MKKIKLSIISMALMVASVVGFTATLAPTVYALDPGDAINSGVDATGGSGAKGIDVNLKTVVNVLLFILGAIAVIMIVVGGIRYAVSGGDQKAVTDAKNTILYAVVGLVVAMLAYAIVNFVVTQFK